MIHARFLDLEHQATKHELDHLQSEKEYLFTTNLLLKAENDILKDQLRELSILVFRKQQDLSNLELQSDSLQDSNADLKFVLAEISGDLERSKRQQDEYKQECCALSEKIDLLQQQLFEFNLANAAEKLTRNCLIDALSEVYINAC